MALPAYNADDMVSMTRKTLEFVRLTMSKQIGATTLDRTDLRKYEIPGIDGMVVDLTTELLADKIADDHYEQSVSFDYPSSWWQHLKQEKMPQWFNRRFPVETQTTTKTVHIKFERFATYPKSNVIIRKDHPFFMQTLGGLETIRDEVHSDIVE